MPSLSRHAMVPLIARSALPVGLGAVRRSEAKALSADVQS